MWLWAAYRKGAFRDMMVDGMDRDQFIGRIREVAVMFDEMFLVFAKTPMKSEKLGDAPIGLVAANIDRNENLDLHVRWMPWASTRNKIEGALKTIRDLSDQTILMHVAEDEKDFFTHLSRYGVIRKVGSIDGYFQDGTPAILYQSRKI